MAHRSFRDSFGRVWEAWEVIPTSVERRAIERQKRPEGINRRRRQEPRIAVRADLRGGWLAFQYKTERRRLAPIPNAWMDMSDAELAALLGKAVVTGTARRLIE
jgi:hypothetical protein